ncbi:hypothetical protein EX895_004721 [Sporisorium graminicola]|uniref:1-phosphatidylinositol 4-kinase n=1 Tax=Sporisorium graminicola TaxID=280036 RepID=A0A4U7KUB8_9BASI|nr:hypothetical protein EX895_004721 [Sporisorium graminicola]TKY86572.1 hypothetical protein EX895_004721 [Sporisorium graminicola]
MATSNEDERAPLLPQHTKFSDGHPHPAPRTVNNDDNDDDLDFDARFRKWKMAVARKFRGKSQRETKPSFLITHFDGLGQAQAVLAAKHASAQRDTLHEATSMTSKEFQKQVEQVKHAIQQGVYPKMIATGSSGSYFVRVITESAEQETQAPLLVTVAVFKPKDEEPYGNLNPKRQFLRKYLWWAMGRPCLIPNFSYLSEVGASYLDARLALKMVPRTELVELSSPTFHYAYHDRVAFDKHHVPLPNKIGSYQTFLKGYVNASDFLRRHPWPSRTRSKTLILRDMDDESRAHKVSRRKERARLRNCGTAIKRALLCRPSWGDLGADEEPDLCHPDLPLPANSAIVDGQESRTQQPDGFYWTPKRMEQFRLQLERLVVLDFLMRNTDRGLDNFMIKHDVDKDEIRIGAIDNSLSFPLKHPNEIRQYPFGWLFLPSDLIGLPFSQETREHLLPILNDPVWWQGTVKGLRRVFEQDPWFDEAKFERQMSVMRGQGWNLVQCLQEAEEGPLDLCAREKKLIRQEVVEVPVEKLARMDGVRVVLDAEGLVVPDAEAEAPESPGWSKPGGSKPVISRTISSGVIETDRRPIGMRASESYRKALLEAAGASVTPDMLDELEDLQRIDAAAQGSISASLPQPSTVLRDKMQAEASPDVATAATVKADVQRARHQRYASANDAGVFHRGPGDAAGSGSDRVHLHSDSVLGRTGIEVLEGLDRERKQQSRLNFFRTRKRSGTTVSHSDEPSASGALPSSTRRESDQGSAGRAETETATYDLASSIVSDPGVRVKRWPARSRSATRPAAGGGGMYGSLYDLQQGEVLSEEEEDEEEEEGQASRRVLVKNQYVPTIETVLKRGNGGSSSEDGGKAFVPHIPHPTSVGPSGQGQNQAAESTPSGSRRTVKVIVEKITSDTKQAWLKWI